MTDKDLQQKRREAYDRAQEFWDEYDIPFEHDIAIKGRRTGLSRGSWGDGRASNTVNHLYVVEAFKDGRLQRDADRYLCDDSTQFRFDGERHLGPDGAEYMPAVTCETCLKRMERWEGES